jgi:hypothetical protein
MLHSVCCDNKHLDHYYAPAWGAAAVAAGAAGQPWGWPLSLKQLALMWPQVSALQAQGWQLVLLQAWPLALLQVLLQEQLA